MAAHDGGEQPRADDVVGLRAHVHREDPREQVWVVDPAAGDLRGERRRRPRVHHVGVADEPAGLAALVLGEPGGQSVDGSTGSRVSSGVRISSYSRVAVVVEAVPQRDRNAEEALAADQPVAVEPVDPVLVAVAACAAGAS